SARLITPPHPSTVCLLLRLRCKFLLCTHDNEHFCRSSGQNETKIVALLPLNKSAVQSKKRCFRTAPDGCCSRAKDVPRLSIVAIIRDPGRFSAVPVWSFSATSPR